MQQKLTLLFLLASLLQGCNTLYNAANIDLEIVVPAKRLLHDDYQKIAVKYNNTVAVYNPKRSTYFLENEEIIDTLNTDSLASEVYYQVFLDKIKETDFFDSVVELPKNYFNEVVFEDTLYHENNVLNDSTNLGEFNKEIRAFNNLLQKYGPNQTPPKKIKALNTEFGLYSKNEIKEIAKKTDADLLFSLDYFESVDATGLLYSVATEFVFTDALWSIYDLREKKLIHFEFKTDTIWWQEEEENLKSALKQLPPRKDAVLNGADIAATQFAQLIVPHWVKVERMYYCSGQMDLKQTNEMVKENNWLEAAKIWKKHTTNPNKSIAAKCMFNMAVACEIQGDLEAALEWVVKSYYVFENKNELHAKNCTSYIRVLGQRKLDFITLDKQFN